MESALKITQRCASGQSLSPEEVGDVFQLLERSIACCSGFPLSRGIEPNTHFNVFEL
jgi:hypothetical protein